MNEKTIKEYLTYRAIECKSQDNLKNYERQIRAFLGKNKKIDEDYLTRHVNKLSNELSPTTLNNTKALLKNFIKWKFPDYSVQFRNLNKICKTKKAPSSYAPKQMLKEKDVKKLIKGETDLFWKCFWLVFFYGGFRGIDTIRLKWEDVEFGSDGKIVIKAFIEKNQKYSYKGLPAEVTPLIKKWRAVNPSKLMFPSPHGDKPINPKTPNERLARLSKRVLGYKINPYLLRHSVATIGYNKKGVNEDDWANQMGHSKSMKEVYSHLDDNKLKRNAKGIWTAKDEMPKKEKDRLLERIEKLEEGLRKFAKWNQEVKKFIKEEIKREEKSLGIPPLSEEQKTYLLGLKLDKPVSA